MSDPTGTETTWAKLQRRKVVQWSLAYVAAGWTLLQALEYAVETFHWPDALRQETTLVVVLALPVVVVIAWYHGDLGQQRVTRTELSIVALLLLAGGAVVSRYEPLGGSVGDWVGEARGQQGNRVAPAQPHPLTAKPPAPAASIAVLPFAVLSSGEDDGYFADGLTEEIINALSALPDLLVTARTSAFQFKTKAAPIPDIAAALGVAHVLEGSVRRSRGQMRITAQLVRASDGFHLWSENYDHTVGDDLGVQTQIAESVAAALGVLLDARRRVLMADAGVRDVEAFVAFQRGVQLFDAAHNEGPMLPRLEQANVHFETAIARKPDFAQAYLYHADLFAHFLIDDAPVRGSRATVAAGIDVAAAAARLLADLDASYLYERDPAQRRVIQVLRTTVTSDWRWLDTQILDAYAGWNNCRHGLWIDQTAIVFGHGEAALAHDVKRAQCDPLGGNWTREAITAVWLGRPLDGLASADRVEARRRQDRDVIATRILAFLALGRVDEAEALYAAGGMGTPDAPPAMRLLALQIPAAAGRGEAWASLRPSVDGNPARLLVGAAVFGDRATANRVAAEIDAMTLGPTILLRYTDRCGCGAPFDLDATPNLANQLRRGGLQWAPPAPIKFPLKSW